jgi:hypothetical protein
MTLCPIAVAVTCKKCPAYGFCPLKTLLGDEPAAKPGPEQKATSSGQAGPKR